MFNLKNVKDKVTNKVKESKAKKFVDDHKRNIVYGSIAIVSGIVGLKLSRNLFMKGYKYGTMNGVRSAGIAIDTALKANNVDPELQHKLAKDSGEVLGNLLKNLEM